MSRSPLALALTAAALGAVLVAPRASRAGEPASVPAPPPGTTAPPPSVAPAAGTAAAPTPADAATALEHARAAYEYGEMEDVVESARLVAEGRLSATPAERAQALRYLGIGLFLTGRREGAETAFFDLLRLRPGIRLDPTTTRPDAVAFFEDVRRRHAAAIDEAARSRPGKSLALAFLPPAGQFQSGHRARGVMLAAVEGLSLATAIGTYAQLSAWDTPTHDFGAHADTARSLRAINHTAVTVFAASVIIGIIDGVASYYATEPDEPSGQSLAAIFGRGYRF